MWDNPVSTPMQDTTLHTLIRAIRYMFQLEHLLIWSYWGTFTYDMLPFGTPADNAPIWNMYLK